MKTRWGLTACLCYVLLSPGAAAKCSLSPHGFVHCIGKDNAKGVFTPLEEPDDVFSTDHTDHPHWTVEREAPKKTLHLPKLRLGGGPQVSYHKRDITLTQDCWHLTFRAFSKIALACSSTF